MNCREPSDLAETIQATVGSELRAPRNTERRPLRRGILVL